MTSLGQWHSGGFEFDPWFGSPFSSDIWDPRRGRDDDISAAIAHASVDWRETDTAHIIRADLPGVGKEELKVEVEEGKVLHIRGEKSKEEEETGDRWHRVERQRGSFIRRFRLPENANTEAISCALENGVLTVNVPKKNPAATTSTTDVRMIDIA